MSQAQLAAGPDRLPWLSDDAEPARRVMPRPRGRSRLAAALVALLAIAAAFYWLGTQSWRLSPAAPVEPRSTTVALPPAASPQPEVKIEATPQVAPPAQPAVRQSPQPQVHLAKPQAAAPPATEDAAPAAVGPPSLDGGAIVPPPTTAPAVAQPRPAAARPPAVSRAPAAAQRKPVARQTRRQAAKPAPLTLWPARVSSGAYGRLVQIGAFGSRQQAKLGWRAMVRAYPGVSRLPAVVVEARNSRGRPFYRFQIGTTSQAHSEVLCQRMEKIRFSCAVVGLPQKPRGIER